MSDAELLVEAANAINGPRIVQVQGPSDPYVLARIATALTLRRKPGLSLRAIIERWDIQRVIKELY